MVNCRVLFSRAIHTNSKCMIPDFGLCRLRRSDKDARGVIVFDTTSTVTLSPMNFQYGLASILVPHGFQMYAAEDL